VQIVCQKASTEQHSDSTDLAKNVNTKEK